MMCELALWQFLWVMRQAVYTERENIVSVPGWEFLVTAGVGWLRWFIVSSTYPAAADPSLRGP